MKLGCGGDSKACSASPGARPGPQTLVAPILAPPTFTYKMEVKMTPVS